MAPSGSACGAAIPTRFWCFSMACHSTTLSPARPISPLSPARNLTRATVLPGALSARFGPRAAAGVILLETSGDVEPWQVSTWAGSLEQFGLGAGGGGAHWNGNWQGRVEGRGLDGGCEFTIPPEAGGGEAYRGNADLVTWSASTGWSGPSWGGDLSAMAGFETLERGLPGRSFAPSQDARQDLDRARFSAGWNVGALEKGLLSVRTYATRQTTRFRDSDPPFGAPYDDGTVLRAAGASVEGAIPGIGVLRAISGGVDVDVQSVESDALSSDAPPPAGRSGAACIGHVVALGGGVVGGHGHPRALGWADRSVAREP